MDTSVALIIAKTLSPSLRFIRSTEPVVIIDVTFPAAVRIATSDTTLSETIFSIVPARRFLMLVLTVGSLPQVADSLELNSGSDNDGDDGGGKLDARCTRSIGCHCNTNMAGNKSSTVADSTRRDNNCSASDKRNSRLGIQNLVPLRE